MINLFIRAIVAAALAGIAATAALTGLDRLAGSEPRAWDLRTSAEGQEFVEVAEARPRRGPTPDWVDPVAIPDPDAAEAARIQGVRVLLWDQQYEGADETPTSFNRTVFQVMSAAGARTASTYSYEFDPAHQDLVLHEAVVHRDGARLDRMDDLVVTMTRPQADLSTAMVTGAVAALVRVPDVRAGDLVELSYSVVGVHDMLDHAANFAPSAPSAPVAHLHVTARLPAGSNVSAFGAFAGYDSVESGGAQDVTLHDGAYAPTAVDPLIPPWRFPADFALMSSLDGWEPVAEWAAPYYEPQVTPAVEEIAREIAGRTRDPDERVVEALRFVQREIRYFAVSLGQGGYQPISPDETLRLREGDCKAKTLLLISILAALDIDADAALANLTVGRGLDALAPSPLAFDHVIVTLERDGRRYWLDPTRSEQGGSLETLSQADYGFALIAEVGQTDLTAMEVAPAAPLLEVTERYVLDAENPAMARAELSWRYRGGWADAIRQIEEVSGPEVLARNHGAIYAQRFETETVIEPFALSSDLEANVSELSGVRRVRLHDLGAGQAPVFAFTAHAATPMAVLAAPGREDPVLLPYPHHVRHRIEVVAPSGTDGIRLPETETLEFVNAAFRQASRIERSGAEVALVNEVEVLAPEIAGKDVRRALEHQQAALFAMPLIIGDPSRGLASQSRMRAILQPSLWPTKAWEQENQAS
ncbi:hypothetical protein DDZ18_02885 [Marinicauda salina]|uniref:DUF3857 domain-containing protein n=1 Tax=Marinicauda salina TaxID=2135793 RepID=A0A2U2BX20_9PROT|nr:DUF3857 domain-containing protein [Marinicauda salina]PWE18566.1 hypothetical protein DDZ18_02885 [Marinicauda salina]